MIHINHTNISYGDNYSITNSIVESDKNKQKPNFTKEKKNDGKNQPKSENKMIISQDNKNSDIINVQNVNKYREPNR
jgi:hypothetical protein